MFQNIKELPGTTETLSFRTLRVFRHPYDTMRTGVVLELAKSGDFASVRQRAEKLGGSQLVARKTPWKVTGGAKRKGSKYPIASFFRGDLLNFGGEKNGNWRLLVQTLADLYLKSNWVPWCSCSLSWNPCAIFCLDVWFILLLNSCFMLKVNVPQTIFLLVEWCSYLGFSEFQHYFFLNILGKLVRIITNLN